MFKEMALSIRKTVASVLRSRLFLLVVILWILLSLVFVALSEFGYNSLPLRNNVIAQTHTTTITGVEGGLLSVYSQTFDEYGNGIPDGNVYYNLSVNYGTTMQNEKSGYAGITNSTGMIYYNISGLQYNEMYNLQELVYRNGALISAANTPVITLIGSGTSTTYTSYLEDVSVTPVIDQSNSLLYSLHIWKPPAGVPLPLTVHYGIFPYFYIPGNLPQLVTFNYTNLMGNLTLGYEATVATGFHISGPPYYYGVALMDQNNVMEGASFFGTVPSQHIIPDLVADEVSGLLAVFLTLWTFILVVLINNSGNRRDHGLSGLIMKDFPDIEKEGRLNRFYAGIFISAVTAIPLVLISEIMLWWLSYSILGTPPLFSNLIGYSVALIGQCVFAGAIVNLIMFWKPNIFLRRQADQSRMEKLKSSMFDAAIAAMFYIYFLLNIYGIFYDFTFHSIHDFTHALVLTNAVNPLAFSLLVGQYISKNLLIGGIFTFNPTSYTITFTTVTALGVTWFILLVILPVLVLRRKETS